MTVDTTFPEDPGTGAQLGDYNDAANYAMLARAIGWRNWVVTGLTFSVDLGAPSLDITAGMAVVTVTTTTGDQSGESRDLGNSFVIQADARSNLDLTDNAVNEVYVQTDLGADDNITFPIITSGTPSAEFLKIGEVDTNESTASAAITEQNRGYQMLDGNLNLQGNGIEAQDETLLLQYQNSAIEAPEPVRFAAGGGVNDESLGGDKTLTVGDAMMQRLDPGGTSRIVTLPAETDNEGLYYRILNTASAAEDLTIQDDGGTNVVTLNQNEASWFCCDGASWFHMGVESISLT